MANNNLVPDPDRGVPGMELPGHEWCALNRLRKGHARCAAIHFDFEIVQHVTAVITDKQ